MQRISELEETKRKHKSTEEHHWCTNCFHAMHDSNQCIWCYGLFRLGVENALWDEKLWFCCPLYSIRKRFCKSVDILFFKRWISPVFRENFKETSYRRKRGGDYEKIISSYRRGIRKVKCFFIYLHLEQLACFLVLLGFSSWFSANLCWRSTKQMS